MSTAPDIAIILLTYQRPGHLRRALASIEVQQDCPSLEVIVTDDGSTDETADMVRDYARKAPYPVTWVSHPHRGFRIAKCRNQGVAASRAEYLIFLDSDCVIPPNYVCEHWRRRRPGVVLSGDVIRLSSDATKQVTIETIRRGIPRRLIPSRDYRRLWKAFAKSWEYRLCRRSKHAPIFGGSHSMHRSDFERVNGYDENFFGWGGEDNDLKERLVRAGVHVHCTPPKIAAVHLWHPPHETAPAHWREGLNVGYLQRPGKLTRCVQGLTKRTRRDIRIRLTGWEETAALREILPPDYHYVEEQDATSAEIEIVLFPARPRKDASVDCRIVLMLSPPTGRLPAYVRKADYLVAPPDTSARDTTGDLQSKLATTLDGVCGFRVDQHGSPVGSRARAA